MRRLSLLFYLIPLMLLAGCEGVVIDLGDKPETQVKPARKPKSAPKINIDIHVLAFTAKWCPACKRDKPQIEEMRRRNVKVTVIDADEQPQLLKEYRVKSLPTYIVYQDDVEIKRTGDIILVVTILAKILKILIPIILPLLL